MKPRNIFRIIAAIIVVGLLATLAVLTQETYTGVPLLKQSPQDTDAQPVTIVLPNAEPVIAIVQNYLEPSSQWVVVSKSRPLAQQEYVPADLIEAPVASNPDKSREERSVRELFRTPLQNLFNAAKTKGYDLMVANGYRSYDLQNTYYSNYVATSGQEAADTYSARPGYSEHQTGLAVDISLVSRECYLEACFGATPAGAWLAAHAHEYGFILRYPENKSSVTGYQFEPWHFRYVGPVLANALHDSGLTLDEAWPYLDKALTQLKQQGQL
jgi:D-alanyl-D-alanine carboxypeptidase